MDRAQLSAHIQRQADGGYVLSGRKTWISNGHVSTWHMVLAHEDLASPVDTMALLAVRTDAKGFQLGAIENKLGQKACVASELVFDQCPVPADQVAIDRHLTQGLGRPHREIVQTLMDYIASCTRAGVGAFSAGTARGAYEATRDFTARKAMPSGRLIEQQGVQAMLAEMSKNATLARQAYLESALANGMGGLFRTMFFRPLYWADQLVPLRLWRLMSAWILRSPAAARWFQQRFLAQQPAAMQNLVAGLASMAKFAASDMAVLNAGMALDLAGPDALRHERGMEKRLRDAKVLQIYEGTNQLNRINLFKCRLRPDEGVQVFVREDGA
jgi:alkylation response protein AidB-like acyl-CoA dehydrogenase